MSSRNDDKGSSAPTFIVAEPLAGDDIVNTYHREVKRFSRLEKDEEKALGRELLERYSADVRNRLVEHNLRLALWGARRLGCRKVEYLDRVQQANIGLIQAADGFDFSRGGFAAFAMNSIRWELSKVARSTRRKLRQPTVRLAGFRGKPGCYRERRQEDFIADRSLIASDELCVARETLAELCDRVAAMVACVHDQLGEERCRFFVVRYGLSDSLRKIDLPALGTLHGITKQAAHKRLKTVWQTLRREGFEGGDRSFLGVLEYIQSLEDVTGTVVRFVCEGGRVNTTIELVK